MTNELVIHELKCWPEYFGPIIDGRKTFEVRKNDRGFKSGHTLHLREWRPQPEGGGYYTGRETHVRVLGVYSDIPAVREGYVVMSLGNGVRDSHEPCEVRPPVKLEDYGPVVDEVAPVSKGAWENLKSCDRRDEAIADAHSRLLRGLHEWKDAGGSIDEVVDAVRQMAEACSSTTRT